MMLAAAGLLVGYYSYAVHDTSTVFVGRATGCDQRRTRTVKGRPRTQQAAATAAAATAVVPYEKKPMIVCGGLLIWG